MESAQAMKFLGVQFNWKLAFTKHMDEVVIKVRKEMIMIRITTVANCEKCNFFIPGSGSFCDSICKWRDWKRYKMRQCASKLKD